MRAILLVCAGAGAVALFARRLLSAVTVRGGSMSPTLTDGDVLLVLRHRRPLAAGRIAVLERPDRETGWSGPAAHRNARGWYVKRIAAAPGDPVPEWAANCAGEIVPPGMFVVLGEHPASEDSKQWGYCPEHRMFGVALLRLRRGTQGDPTRAARSRSGREPSSHRGRRAPRR